MSYAEITLKSGAQIAFDCVSLKWERSSIRTSMEWELPEGASRRPVHFDVDEVAAVVFVDTTKAVYTATSEEQFRVETAYRSDPERWVPESDRVFTTRESAEEFMSTKADWYDNPERFKHRITRRTVTSWEPVR